MSLSRRNFLGTSAAAVVAAGTMVKGKVEGANEKINMLVMGVNGRGNAHIKAWIDSPDTNMYAFCDADARILKMKADGYEKKYGIQIKRYTDIREALQDPNIDAVSIASPNHWHALATVWAVEAGKDVYVEKPASHEVFESHQLAKLAASSDRIIQHGTQSRSKTSWLRDIPLLQSGEIIGNIHTARALGYKNGNRGSLGHEPNKEAPNGLDWRLWQGPASEQSYNKLYHPYSWHWFWHYGNGEIGNQGVHQMDVAAWGMNKGIPSKVYSAGGRYTYDDQGETPNTNVATFTYDDGSMLVFEVRNRWTNDEAGVNVGNLFYGEGGYYVEGKGFFDTKNQPIELDASKYPTPEAPSHFQNFINAVKSRDKGEIKGTMDDAHMSCTCCHLANTSYRLGRSLNFDPKALKFADDEANSYLKREYHPDFVMPTIA
jgi:predicted dehydrogenase